MAYGANVARAVWSAIGAFAMSGCASTVYDVPAGQAAYSVIPAADKSVAPESYLIGNFDRLNVTVYGEPELSGTNLAVDDSGNINLPLVGRVAATNKTTDKLGGEIETLYNAKYLKDAKVTVVVATALAKRVTVDGAVNAPGVYDIQGQMTLVEAIAQAKGVSRVAAMNEILVFRSVNGARSGAQFDLQAIREGKAEDPVLLGSDIVVVGKSGVKGAWRDFLGSIPVIGLFRFF